jgi:hypothetical protein
MGHQAVCDARGLSSDDMKRGRNYLSLVEDQTFFVQIMFIV